MTGSQLLVGREAETTELGAFLDELAIAAAACVLEGEPGIGKTTLWRHAVESAAVRGYRVLSSRPVEAESQLSYSGIGDLLAESAPPVVAGLPAPQARALESALLLREPEGSPPTDRAVAVAVLGVLQRLAAQTPVVVAVDDLQWLDHASATVLSFAARRLQAERVGLLLAVRTPSAAPELGVILDRSPVGERLRRIRLGPLGVGALRTIVHLNTHVALTRPLLRRLHEVSRGNPFFAIELSRALGHDAGSLPELRLPTSLHNLVGDRLAGLPPDELEVLTVAAVLSQPTLELVSRVLGREPRVSEAVAAGIIETPGDPIRFTHPLLASAVSSRPAPGERRALHLRLASVLADEEQAARQLALAATGPDAAAAAILERAAATVRARGTSDTAAELAEQAVQMTPPDDRADLHRRRLAAASYHFDAGDSERASALLTEVLSVATPGAERAEARLELGIVMSDLARTEDAALLMEEALSECHDDALAAIAHLNLAWIHAELSGPDQAARHAWSAVRIAERLEDPALLAQALASTIYGGLLSGRTDAAAAAALTRGVLLERVLNLNMPLERRPTYVEAIRLTARGEFDAARELLQRLVQLGRDTADAAVIGPLTVLTALDDAAGRLDAALRGAVEAAEIAEQVGRETPRAGCLSLLARVEATVGRLGDARGHAGQALALAEQSGHPFYIAMARTVLAFIELSVGDLGAATRWLDPVLPLMAELALRGALLLAVRSIVDPIGILAGAGRADEAGLLVERLQAAVEAEAPPLMHAISEHCDGVVRAARGDLDGALIALGRALEHHETAATCPFDRGLTLLELGRVERRLRQRRDARATLERALAVFDSLGAPVWAEMVRREIGRIGGRTAADGLTASEHRIASLVAEGRSNREVAAELFVTVRTVETALTRIYRKLDVRSRAELAHKFVEVR